MASIDPMKRAAQQAVQRAVRKGRLAPPNSLPCTDCGGAWAGGTLRHEYDHYLGYAPEHRLDVQVVCKRCHARRDSLKKRRTTCPQGHPYDETNTLLHRDGTRSCRACNRDHARVAAQRQAKAMGGFVAAFRAGLAPDA